MQNELQRQDIVTNPVIEIFRKLFMAIKEAKNKIYELSEQDEINDALLGYTTNLMKEITSMWFGGEAAMVYAYQGQQKSLTVKNGEVSSAGLLETATFLLRGVQKHLYSPSSGAKELEEFKAFLQEKLQVYFSLTILKTSGDGDRIQRAIIRENDSHKLLILLRLQSAFLINYLVDVSKVNAEATARRKVAIWQHQDMGLAFVISKKPKQLIASNYLADKSKLQRQLIGLIASSNGRSINVKRDGYLILASGLDPKRQHRTVVIARKPAPTKQPGMLFLVIVFGISGCIIFILLIEAMIFRRGSGLSLKSFIVTIFILVSMLPMLSSAYLTNEFVTANFKKEKNSVARELSDELLSLDMQTFLAYRASINQVKNLDSVEKLCELTQLPASTPIKDLSMAAILRLAEISKKAMFSEVWVYNENYDFSSVKQDWDKKKYNFSAGNNAMLVEFFLPRYREYLLQQNPELKPAKNQSQAETIEFDELKTELLDSFFLNMFGDKTYYKIHENFGSILRQESFMDTNAILSVPISLNGRARYVFTWIFDSKSIREHLPQQSLRTDPEKPIFALYGNDQYVGTRPPDMSNLSRNFPTLMALANQSLLTGSRLFMQDYLASGSPIFEARPARYSDLILCGSRSTRDLESINRELLAEALKYFVAIALTGMLLAILTSMYFTIPIRQLTDATQQIADGNYEIRLDPRHPDEFAIAAATFNKMAVGLQEGQLLSSFVSESVKELATREHLTSEDIAQTCQATVLFSSIKDFQTLQQKHDPEKTFEILQAHLSAAVDAVARFGGEIDKMIEEKVMIVFDNKKYSESEHVRAATEVALAIKKEMNRQYGLLTAAGITTGEVVSGVMGASTVRLSKTVVGDTVNLAARLAVVAADLTDGGIVAAESCVRLLPSVYSHEKLPISQVKGKTQTVEAFLIKELKHA